MRNAAYATGTVLLAIQVGACHSPASPDDFDDPRTGIPVLKLTCVPDEIGARCESIVEQTGFYSRGGPRDVTAIARWISTNMSVGTFTAQGRLEVRGSGSTLVYAESDPLYSREAFGYRVDAGGRVTQIGVVDVSVWSTTGGFLPLASVAFTPQSGDPQNCQLGFGPPYTPCRFWSDLGTAVIRASKPGYTSVEQSFTPSPTNTLPLSSPRGLVVKLTPVF